MEMTYTEKLVVTSCWCGINLAVPSGLYSYAKNHKGKAIHCPLGHEFIFNDSFEEKLAQERMRHAATRDLLTQEERSHIATRGHLTRARKRAAAGVCPCCKRHFANVQRHVDSQHPDFKPEELPA